MLNLAILVHLYLKIKYRIFLDSNYLLYRPRVWNWTHEEKFQSPKYQASKIQQIQPYTSFLTPPPLQIPAFTQDIFTAITKKNSKVLKENLSASLFPFFIHESKFIPKQLNSFQKAVAGEIKANFKKKIHHQTFRQIINTKCPRRNFFT